MSLGKARSGFFVVPFWNAEGKLIEFLEGRCIMTPKKTTRSNKTKQATKAEAAQPVGQADAAAATPTPAKTKTKKVRAPKALKAKKTSALDAALRVLEEAGRPAGHDDEPGPASAGQRRPLRMTMAW
jgi:hypothetical protein